MTYDTTSPDTSAVRTAAQLDQRSIDRAAGLAACETSDQIRIWMKSSLGRSLHDRDNAYAAGFGTLAALTGELLGIIGRQREEITALREGIRELRGQLEDQADVITVPMVCTVCRRPVIETVHGDWGHVNIHDGRECEAYPVKAMVAAGNQSVPRA